MLKGWWKHRRNQGDSMSLPALEARPKHIAIIMDGNGRWARRRGLPRVAGHHAGMTTVREIIRACDDFGIECLTLYAFSTENWKRPEKEVEYLMRLPEQFFRTEIDELVARGVRVRFIGDTSKLPAYTQETVRSSLLRTQHNAGMIVNFALNYGGRWDVLTAVQAIAGRVAEGEILPADIDEELITETLSTGALRDPDLIIRTSGEIRLSNFLIWQAAYAELWFTDLYWPDFSRETLGEAIKDFAGRKRRYGDIE